MSNFDKKKILTWHVHGNYLYYLTQLPHQFFVSRGGKTVQFPWGSNVQEVDINDIPNMDLDLIIFQSRQNFENDQYEMLSLEQQQLPKIYIEHDPPREHPTDTLHPVNDGKTTIVHVTQFNQLMWDNHRQPSVVIEHGIKLLEKATYTGELEKGVVVINNLASRGRRLGLDVFLELRKHVPLDLIGMGSKELNGLGEVVPKKLPKVMAQYRFIFSPIRYTSLGLSLIEAMMVGLPLIGLATTELVSVIENHTNGFIALNPNELISPMKKLLRDKPYAHKLSNNIKKIANKRFSIERFCTDWNHLINQVTVARSMSHDAYSNDQRTRFTIGTSRWS